MPIIEIFLLACALAMDAFAVCVSLCSRQNGVSAQQAWRLALSFGIFQGILPLLGWTVGQVGTRWVSACDHWIAFGLLTLIGIKMIWEGLHPSEEAQAECPRIGWRTLLLLSIATSIDAAAVGISLSLLEHPILLPSLVIGIVTTLICWAGVHFGRLLGSRFGKGAEVGGGVVLVAIALRILYQHGML